MVVATSELAGGDADGGVSWLLLAGVFLVVGPFVFDRLTGVSVGPDGPARFDLSKEVAGLGARSTAPASTGGAAGLAESAAAYAAAHTVLRDEAMRDAKVRLQDHFVDAAAASALVQRYDADEVRTLFRHGPPVIRVLALWGLMIGDPSLADAATIESAITESRTRQRAVPRAAAGRTGRPPAPAR